MPIIWDILKDNILELTPDRVAHLENIIVRETLRNDQFRKQLEGALKAELRGGAASKG
jgi:hypothetical protein